MHGIGASKAKKGGRLSNLSLFLTAGLDGGTVRTRICQKIYLQRPKKIGIMKVSFYFLIPKYNASMGDFCSQVEVHLCHVSPKKFTPFAKMTSRNFLPPLSSFRPQLINQRAVILGDKNSFSFAWPYFVFPLFPVNGIFCLCLALPFSPSECFDSVFSCPGRKYIFLLPFSSPFLFISTYSLKFLF